MLLIIYNSVAKEWNSAKQYCEDNNSTLLTVSDDAQANALHDLMNYTLTKEVFIGGQILKIPFTWYNSLV